MQTIKSDTHYMPRQISEDRIDSDVYPGGKVRIFFADDHTLFRSAFSLYLSKKRKRLASYLLQSGR